jgi:hypothetical protein
MSKSTGRNSAPAAKQTGKANADHKFNQENSNKGTPGTNKAYDHVQGNRGGQLNPNRQPG